MDCQGRAASWAWVVLVGLDHGDVVGLLGLDRPEHVRLDRVQGVEGHDDAVSDCGGQMPAHCGETG